MSKVFRLNQVDVQSAAEYLASLGASMTAVKTVKSPVVSRNRLG